MYFNAFCRNFPQLVPNIDLWRAIGSGFQRLRERIAGFRAGTREYNSV